MIWPTYQARERVRLPFGEYGTVKASNHNDIYLVDVDDRGFCILHARHLAKINEEE